jgi:hypothetical protein
LDAPFAADFGFVSAGVALGDVAGATGAGDAAELGAAGGSLFGAAGGADAIGAGVAGATAGAEGSGLDEAVGSGVTMGDRVGSGACCGSGGDQFALWHPFAQRQTTSVTVRERRFIVTV